MCAFQAEVVLMKASVLDLRRRPREVLRALERNETVTLLYRGKEKGVIHPAGAPRPGAGRVAEHPAFGIWRDRADLVDVSSVVRNLRRGRTHAL